MTALIDITSLFGLVGCLRMQLADESRRRQLRARNGARIVKDDAPLGVSRWMQSERDSDEARNSLQRRNLGSCPSVNLCCHRDLLASTSLS